MGLPFPSLCASIALLLGATAVSHAQQESADCCCQVHGTPSCADSNCSGIVCQMDAYCCTYQWDAQCASLAAAYCGAAAPYCTDGNNDGTPDVCASAGPNPGDCNGNGIPDLNESGCDGSSYWSGPTSGSALDFENPLYWSCQGRPGTATSTQLYLPYSQYQYSSMQWSMDCDNAVQGFTLWDSGGTAARDFQWNLGGRTLRITGSALEFHSYSPGTLTATIASGNMLCTDSPLFLVDEGAQMVKFSGVQISAGTFGWNTPTYGGSPRLSLQDSTLVAGAFGWPSVNDGLAPSSVLTLRNSNIQLSSSATGAMSSFAIPDGATLLADAVSSADVSKILGTGLYVYADAGSTLQLDGRLEIGGSLNVGGTLTGRSHCAPWLDNCQASVLLAHSLVFPTPGTPASMVWNADLSGSMGGTPDGLASIRVSGGAWIDGTLRVNDLSPNGVPTVGFSVPLLTAAAFTTGHSNFDLVRAFNNDGQPLSGGYYVSTENVGGTIYLTVKRGAGVLSTPSLQSSLPDSPLRTVVMDEGTSSGVAVVATITSTSQGSIIRRFLVNLAQGTMIQSGTLNGLVNPTDMVAGDINGDGQRDLLVSYGSPGKTVAYRWTGTGFATLWTKQFPAGTRAECVCIIPPRAASLMPAGSSTATGTSTGTKGGVTTTDAGGATTGTAEVASVPRTVNGTDIDDDDAVATGGADASAAFMPGQAAGFIQMVKRGPTGGLVALTKVSVAGVPNALVIADLDGDGLKDVAASCSGITGSYADGARPVAVVLRGAGAASASRLSAPIAIDVGDASAQGASINVTDADGNGYPDLAVGWTVTSTQQGSTLGGASIVQIRDQRASGGLTLGTLASFSASPALGLSRVGDSSLFSMGPPSASGGTPVLRKTDFAADPIPGDLDGDGLVGPSDLSILLLDFGPCPDPTTAACPSDLDGSGIVDNGDISLLLIMFD